MDFAEGKYWYVLQTLSGECNFVWNRSRTYFTSKAHRSKFNKLQKKNPSTCLIKFKKRFKLRNTMSIMWQYGQLYIYCITDTDVELVSYRVHAVLKGRSTTQERYILNTYGWETRSCSSHLSAFLYFSNGTLRLFSNTLSRWIFASKKIKH
jgi:hypothetical protein